jgi:hypothetical protein
MDELPVAELPAQTTSPPSTGDCPLLKEGADDPFHIAAVFRPVAVTGHGV